ncbi:hypothetical protein BDN67DRAFT_418764 [Paxillus ammoniavirescens]|nr:hypothetical protein BDN67DRAFT_418764 [Paxillus ammoniavirescens]
MSSRVHGVDPRALQPRLFFWFFPPGPEGSLDNLIFWTNGGPGPLLSRDFFKRTAPSPDHTDKPSPRSTNTAGQTSLPFSGSNGLSAPASQGAPNIESQDQLPEQLVGFMQQFLRGILGFEGDEAMAYWRELCRNLCSVHRELYVRELDSARYLPSGNFGS